jgi:TonB-dependent receptor
MTIRGMKSQLLLLVVLLLLSSVSLAQQQKASVKGVVKDVSGNEIPGVMVLLEQKSMVVITDANGRFVYFDLPSDTVYSLLFSGISYRKKQVLVHLSGNQDLDLHEVILTDSTELTEVEVIGEMDNSEAKALNMMKNATKQTTIVSAEELEKLPIKNAADAVAHVPGVGVQRNQGENSIVTLRGTPSDWSSTLLNGDRLPVADEEQQTRSFEFEALPAEVIDYVVESKTASPEMESDNIGGSINFVTRLPVTEKTFNCDIAGGINAFSSKPTGSFTALFGNVSKNKKISFVADVSYYGRNYSINAVKAVYGSVFNHALNRLELRRYNGLRTTVGGNVGVEYRPNTKVKVGSNFVGGYMADDKYMYKESFNWYDESGTNALRLQSTHGIYNRRIYGGDLYVEYLPTNRLKLRAKVAHYDNRFWYGAAPFKQRNDRRNGFFVTEFVSVPLQFTDLVAVDKFGNASSNPYAYLKLIGSDNPYGTGDNPQNIQPKFTNQLTPDKFHFSQSYAETNQTRERDPIVGQLDAEYKITNRLNVRMGGKFTHKTGFRHISKHEWFQDFSGGNSQAILLSDFATESFMEHPENFMKQRGGTYANLMFPFLSKNDLNNFIHNDEIHLREVYMDKLNYQYNQWVGSNYDYQEDRLAGYGMLDYTTKKLNINGGLRVENTQLFETSDTLTSTVAFDEASQKYYYLPEQRVTRLNYNSFLPSFNATYNVNEKTNIRIAASRTMHRPNFEETKPGHAVIRYNELEYTFGNPKLKPTYSANLDASYEHFWGLKGMFLVGAYYKNIKDHIFAISTGSVDSISGIVTKRYDNAPSSWVLGFEGVFIRKFDFLKGAWKNLGFNANITYSISRMKVPGRTASQSMVGQTPLLYNVGLSYESDRFETKLELGYSGPYLKQLNLSALQGVGLLYKDSDYDVFANSYYSLDFEFTYIVNQRFSVFVEANNLLNSPDRLYVGKSWRVYRTEYYGVKAQIGLKVDL